MITSWDVRSRALVWTLEGHRGAVQSLCADSWVAVSAGADRTVRVWRVVDPWTVKATLEQVAKKNGGPR